jgi:hypothetical protein
MFGFKLENFIMSPKKKLEILSACQKRKFYWLAKNRNYEILSARQKKKIRMTIISSPKKKKKTTISNSLNMFSFN